MDIVGFIYLAAIFALFVAAVKYDENIKLKKENKELKEKLGKIDKKENRQKSETDRSYFQKARSFSKISIPIRRRVS